MSARAWEPRRLNRRFDAAIRRLRHEPEATVHITKAVVLVSDARYERLVELSRRLLEPSTPPQRNGCYGWPRTCPHFDDIECFEAEVDRYQASL